VRAPLQTDEWEISSNVWRLLAWIIGLLLLVTLLWVITELEIRRDERDQRAIAMAQAEALASSYAIQLANFVEQLDQLSLAVGFGWTDAPDRVDLKRDRERGLFPVRDHFFVAIIDGSGKVVHTTSEPKQRVNLSEAPFFLHHRGQCCDGLRIEGPVENPLVGKRVIQFTRRIDDSAGKFAGAVMIALEPNFLSTFQDEVLQDRNDFVAALLIGGRFIATRLGSGGEMTEPFFLEMPALSGTLGNRIETGAGFRDKLDRFVGWRKVDRYPLFAVTGLTVSRALEAHNTAARGYRLSAAVATLFLTFFAIAGIRVSIHYAARRRAEADIRRTYRMATDAANEGFYMLSPVYGPKDQLTDFRIEDCNDRAAILLGSTRTRLTGRRASEAMQQKLLEDLIEVCRRALQSGTYEDEFRVPSQGGLEAKWVYRRAVHSGAGIALTLRDISELKAHEQTLADLANKDALTLLPNRRWLSGFLPEAVQRAQHNDSRLAMFFIDLDNFKLVNDTLGHQAGDELLTQAANRICHAVRASDHVVRLGGDEFTVVLEHIGSNRAIARVADSIIQILSEPFTLTAGAGNRVSASIGISVYPNDGQDADTLLKHADVAMYAAKAEGKSRHHFYHPKLSDAILLRLSKERALRRAIDMDEFIVYYQPRVATHTGYLCSLEALLRWHHPELGLVHPLDFIDVAEDAGLIISIGETVIKKVAMQLDDWRRRCLRVVPVSVNISPYQLRSGSTAAYFEKIVKQYQLPTQWLEVEVTESAVVDRSVVVSNELDTLRKQGVRLMIDDFGAGYSSLAQLHRLDVDVLKVDQAFTHALAEGSEGEIVYRAVVSMAVALDMQVVAEGVETLAQLDLLKKIGCHEIQGHIISPALPANEIELFMQKTIIPPFDRPAQLAIV